jgi:biopolymer transport protein ExbB/TolQ
MSNKEREDTYEAPHSKAPDSKAAGAKEVARPKDEVGPYVPDKRGYFAGLALGGISAGAALHRAGNVAALAVKLGDAMVEEMRKPPPLPDEELKQQQTERAAAETERAAKDRKEQEAGRLKQDQERDKQLEAFAKEQEKVEAAERERATALQ